MKKLISALLALLLCFGALLSLASCNDEHSFANSWVSDSTHHWHPCNDEGCTETSDKAEHVMENGICTVCRYADLMMIRLSVTNLEFELALSSFPFDNVTVVGSMTTADYVGEFYVKVCGNTSSYRSVVNGEEEDNDFYEIAADGTSYYYYVKDGEWTRETTDEYYGISVEAFRESFYFDFSGRYSEMTFDTELRAYVLEGYEYLGATYRGYAKFENGVLVEVGLIGEVMSLSARYSDHDKTEITLPTVSES